MRHFSKTVAVTAMSTLQLHLICNVNQAGGEHALRSLDLTALIFEPIKSVDHTASPAAITLYHGKRSPIGKKVAIRLRDCSEQAAVLASRDAGVRQL